MLANTTKGNTSPDREGGIPHGPQRGVSKDAADNEGACVLYLPGDLETGEQESGTPEGTSIKRKRCQAGTTKLPESFEGKQETTGHGSGRRYRSPHGVGPKAGDMEAPHALVQKSIGGPIPTVTIILGQYSNREGGDLQVQAT